jgi:DNA-binding CsgD family transcriptional regulator
MPGSVSWSVQETPRAIVFVADPSEPPVVSASALKQFYGLTDAETRVCTQVAFGLSVPEIADSLSVSKHTIRAQLKSVFRKCEVSSQVQLVRLLSTLEVS